VGYLVTLSRDRDFDQAAILGSILRTEGYFVDLKVPLNVPTYAENYRLLSVSDLDVFGIRFTSDLSSSVAIAECKTTEQGALDELLKLVGIRELMNADRTYFTKGQIHPNAREVAKSLSVNVYTANELERFAVSLNIDVGRAIEEEDRYHRARVSAARQLKRGGGQLMNYLESEYVLREYHENILNTLYLLGEFLEQPSLTQEQKNWVLLRSAALLSCWLINLAKDVLGSGIDDVGRAVGVYLQGGPRRRRERERLLDELRKASPRSRSIPKTLDGPEVGLIADVVAFFLMTPNHAARVPALAGEGLRHLAHTKDNLDIGASYAPESKKLLRDVVDLLLKATVGRKLADDMPLLLSM